MDSSEENDKLLKDMNDQKIVEYAPAIAYSVLVIVIGITGNIFSIAYYGFKSQRTTTNILITTLATTDLIACVVFCDEIIELCFTIAFKNVIGCKIMYFTNHTIVFTSAFILLLICVDRFQKICRRQSWQMTVKTAKIGIGAVVIFCVIISVRDFVILDVVRVNLTGMNVNKSVTAYYCTHSRDSDMKPFVTAFQLFDFAIFITVIPAMFVLYSLVAREIWIQRKRKESHMQLEISTPSASTSDSRCKEYSTDISATETTSSDLSDVNRKTTTFSDHRIKRDVIQIISDKLSRKHRYEVTEKKDKIAFHHSKRSSEGKVHKPSHPSRKARADSVERKIAIMMIATTAGSVLSFVPYFIVNLAVKRNSGTPEQEFSVGMQIALRSFMMNNAINPYIMGIFNSKFKRFVRDMMCSYRR